MRSFECSLGGLYSAETSHVTIRVTVIVPLLRLTCPQVSHVSVSSLESHSFDKAPTGTGGPSQYVINKHLVAIDGARQRLDSQCSGTRTDSLYPHSFAEDSLRSEGRSRADLGAGNAECQGHAGLVWII